MLEKKAGRPVAQEEPALPAIGEGGHWYDLAQCVVSWVLDEKRRYLPHQVRSLAGSASITLHSIYELHHIKCGDWPHGDPMHVVASGAIHVRVPGVWLVEFFPPSKSEELSKALRDRRWRNRGYQRTFGEYPAETAAVARKSNGRRWWRLGTVVAKGFRGWAPDCPRVSLPESVSSVTVNMVQIGSSITAACAFFEVDDSWMLSIDREWHTAHGPALYKPIGCPRQLSPKSREHELAIYKAQALLLTDARRWMAKSFPGAMASWSEPQPALQMMLFDGPATMSLLSCSQQWACGLMDQLGLWDLEEYGIEGMPGLHIRDLRYSARGTGIEAAEALVGSTDDVSDKLGKSLEAYAPDRVGMHRAITHRCSIEVQKLLIDYGLVWYTECLLRQYGLQRDLADGRFGSYSSTQVDAFRRFVLNNSIDVHEASRDVSSYFEARRRFGTRVTKVPVAKELGDSRAVVDVVDNYMDESTQNLKQVIELDAVYRDVLSTVVSLGTDKRSLVLARVALWVSIVSLVLAVFSMSLTDNTLFAQLVNWLRSCF